MPAAKLDEQGVDGPDLNSAAAAGVANLRGFDVILPVRLDEPEGAKAFDELSPSLRPCKALQQLLQHETGREDLISAEQSIPERSHLRRGLFGIAAQRERPDARVDQQAHRLRARSAL